MLKNIVVFVLVLVFAGSCSNDFDLVDEWKDIPIVYGLLSRVDAEHFIRVEKAFLDPSTSALVLAQNPDSIYYDDAVVQIERVSTGDTFTADRVDGRDFGFFRENGIFATEPNILYRIDLGGQQLEGGEEYKVIINRGDNLPLVTGSTLIVSDFNFLRPTMPSSLNFADYNLPQRVSWRVPPEGVVFDVRIKFNIQETDPSNPGNLIDKELFWTAHKNVKSNGEGQVRVEINGFDFFNFLKNNLEVNPAVDRFLLSYDFIIDAGGQEILSLQEVNGANTGITGSQLIPTFTNLSEGRGLFTSRNTSMVQGFSLQSQSVDSLRNGSLTRDLNFQ